MTPLTPAMRRQLQDLYDVQVLQRSSGGRRVHLPTIRALLDRHLVLEQHGFELEDKIRLHNAYPLTDAGKATVEKENARAF